MRRGHICNDDCERHGYLNTGIHNLPAARRYLRNRFKTKPLPTIDRRAGELYYTVAWLSRKPVPLLGPYVSPMTAQQHMPRAQRQLREVSNDAWLSVGVAGRADIVSTLFGR